MALRMCEPSDMQRSKVDARFQGHQILRRLVGTLLVVLGKVAAEGNKTKGLREIRTADAPRVFHERLETIGQAC